MSSKLTLQIYKDHLKPRVFNISEHWFTRLAYLAWGLTLLTIFSVTLAARFYWEGKNASPERVTALESEVKDLKAALENTNSSTPHTSTSTAPTLPNPAAPQDPLSSDSKPSTGLGKTLTVNEGVWAGLAEGISALPAGTQPTIKLEDAKLSWEGKFVLFTANVAYQNPGQGSQQGHLVVLARSPNSIYSHPQQVLNTATGSALINPERGEYFSVSRFRLLKAKFGPFDSPDQLSEVQVFAFNLNNKIILLNTFKNGK